MSENDLEARQARIFAAALQTHEDAPHPGMPPVRLRLHATIHTVVETQLEVGEPPFVRSTLERLLVGGLDRHSAVHAIGSVAAREVLEAMQQGQAYDEQRYRAALDELDAKTWRDNESEGEN